MAAFSSFLLAGALAASAATTAVSVVKSGQAQDAAAEAAAAQSAAQEKLIKDAQKRQEDLIEAGQESELAAKKARELGRAQQAQASKRAQGRRATILTSPLGVDPTAPVGAGAGKSLLGQ